MMSQTEYFELVEFLENHNPNEPLLPLLKKGFSDANVKIYLPFAMKRIDEARSEEVTIVKVIKLDEKEQNELLRQYGRKYGEVCKESNKLHQHNGNAPKELIDSILSLQNEIDIISSKLNGTYSEAETVTEEQPEGEAKVKKILSLRASISRCKADLLKMSFPDDKTKIEKKEAQLLDYQIKLKNLEGSTIHE
jgi:hypothetical protein